MKIQIWRTAAIVLLVAIVVNGAALQFMKMINKATSLSARDLQGYANYCGIGGGGVAIDNLDRCCKAHDECLSQANRPCFPLFYVPFFIIPYRYSIFHNSIICKSRNSNCQKALCKCDSEAAHCFREYQAEYDNRLKIRNM